MARIKQEPGLCTRSDDTYGDVDFVHMFGLDEFMGQESSQSHLKSNSSVLKQEQPSYNQKIELNHPQFHSENRPTIKTGNDLIASKVNKLKTKALTRPVKVALNGKKVTRDRTDPDILIQYSFLCPHCPFISAHKSSTHRHISTTHASVEGVDAKNIGEKMLFLCRLCSFNSNHKTSAKRHVKTIHKDKNDDSLEISGSNGFSEEKLNLVASIKQPQINFQSIQNPQVLNSQIQNPHFPRPQIQDPSRIRAQNSSTSFVVEPRRQLNGAQPVKHEPTSVNSTVINPIGYIRF